MKFAREHWKWVFIILSIGVAILIVRNDFVVVLLARTDGFERVIAIIAGVLFTSIFTTAPAIVILSELMHQIPVWQVAILGGFGAVFGDFIIFHVIQSPIHAEAHFLLSLPRLHRYRKIFKTRLFHRFMWLLGALVIASPLPDEIGLSLLGVSEIKTWQFILTSFIFNSIGIAILASAISSVVQ
jgi:hypothetical protein